MGTHLFGPLSHARTHAHTQSDPIVEAKLAVILGADIVGETHVDSVDSRFESSTLVQSTACWEATSV